MTDDQMPTVSPYGARPPGWVPSNPRAQQLLRFIKRLDSLMPGVVALAVVAWLDLDSDTWLAGEVGDYVFDQSSDLQVTPEILLTRLDSRFPDLGLDVDGYAAAGL